MNSQEISEQHESLKNLKTYILKTEINSSFIDFTLTEQNILKGYENIEIERPNTDPIVNRLNKMTTMTGAGNKKWYEIENNIQNKDYGIKAIDDALKVLIPYYQKVKKRNTLKSISTFKKKAQFNFENERNNLTFNTFTIATDDSDTPIPTIYGFDKKNGVDIKRVPLMNGCNKKWVKSEFSKFIKRLRKNGLINQTTKYTYVLEPQKRGVWHIHLLSTKFIKHAGKCPAGLYGGKIISCRECNYILAKNWKIGLCMSQNVIDTINNKKGKNIFGKVINYLAKYLSKQSFYNNDPNIKGFVFSETCLNYPVITNRYITKEKLNTKTGIENELEITYLDNKMGLDESFLEKNPFGSILNLLMNDEKVIKKIIEIERLSYDDTFHIYSVEKNTNTEIMYFRIYKSNENFDIISDLIPKMTNSNKNAEKSYENTYKQVGLKTLKDFLELPKNQESPYLSFITHKINEKVFNVRI